MAPHTIETLRLLAVGSEPSVLRLLDAAAHANDWHLETSASGWDAMEQVQSGSAPHLLLLSIPRGEGEGLQLLSWLRRLRPEQPIVVLCDPEDSATQEEATRLGAKDVLLRPFSERQLESVIRWHLGTSSDRANIEMASEDIESLGEDEFFLSVSPAMRQLRAQVELLAKADVPVLILGEPGSGKGTVARLIHQRSVHSGFKFQRVNCAEMPADLLEIELFGRENGSSNGSSRALGKLESGQRGTILLDEITEMPLRCCKGSKVPAPATPGRRKPMCAFSPPAAKRWTVRWRRSECTAIFTIASAHSRFISRLCAIARTKSVRFFVI